VVALVFNSVFLPSMDTTYVMEDGRPSSKQLLIITLEHKQNFIGHYITFISN